MNEIKPTTMRYSDSELLFILKRLAFDQNRVPSQRVIGRSKDAPTYHTYIKRFGSVPLALEEAGLGGMIDGRYHHTMLLSLLKGMENVDVLQEWVDVGPMTVNLTIAINGITHYIDLAFVESVEGDLSGVNDEMQKRRCLIANGRIPLGQYIQITSSHDMLMKIKEIQQIANRRK